MAASNAEHSGKAVEPAGGRRIVRRLLIALIPACGLFAVILMAGWGLRYVAVGQIIELTGAKVETESVDVNFDGSVFIEKLAVRPHKSKDGDGAILEAARVYARFGIGSLLLLRPRLKQISVSDFVFDARYDSDRNRWNVAALNMKLPKRGGGRMPAVSLEKGILRYSKVSSGQVKVVAEIPVDAKFGPADEPHEGYGFTITTARIRAGLGKRSLTGFWKPGRLTLSGGISSDDIAAFESVWMINVLACELNYDRNGEYSLRLVVKDLRNQHRPVDDVPFTPPPEFLKKSRNFAALREFFDRYDPQGQVDIELEASGNLNRLRESRFAGKVYCRDVAVRDREFPYPIEHIAGQVDFTEKSVVLNNLQGQHGDIKVAFAGTCEHFGSGWGHEIQVTSGNMALDDGLYNALSAKEKKFWSAFSPTGLVAIDYRTLRKPGGEKERTLAVELLGAEAAYRGFPYPLENLSGRLVFERDNVVFSDVVSRFGGRSIALNGTSAALSASRPQYEVTIKAQDIPLDSMFAAALPDRHRLLWDGLALSGLADADVNVTTAAGSKGSTGFVADVALKESSLKVGKLARPFSNVSGRIVFRPEMTEIEQLNGRYAQGAVSVTGRIWSSDGAERPCYDLSLQAKQLELDDDLVCMLPAAAKRVVSKLQPGGSVDLSMELKKDETVDRPVDYKVVVDCMDGHVGAHLPANSAGDLPIDSGMFSYPLKNVRGRLTITRDEIALEGITAVAGDYGTHETQASLVRIDGQIALANGALSGASLRLNADNVFFDRRLASALPASVRSLYLWLSPAGRFDLSLDKMQISSSQDGEKEVDFSSVIKFKECNLHAQPLITQLNGTLETKGLYKTDSGFYEGGVVLTADTMKIKGVSVTGLRADMYYDQGAERWVCEELIGNCYGGRLAGKIELKQAGDAISEYQVRIGFDNVDVGDLIEYRTVPKETVGLSDSQAHAPSRGTRHTRGKVGGSLNIIGRMEEGTHNYSRIGSCKLTLSDMQIGKASPLEKLLSVLSLTEPRDFVFERMVVDSYIKQSRVFLRHLDLSGDAVAFNGSGWIDLANERIDLALFARGPRLAVGQPSVIGSLPESLGGAVVRIDVTGNLYDPDVTRTTLSVIKGTLDIFGPKSTAPKE